MVATTRPARLTEAQGNAISALISLGYGAGDGYLPFSEESVREYMTVGEWRAVHTLVRKGLVERGIPGPYRDGRRLYRHGDIEANGQYRLTPGAVEAYQAWYDDGGAGW